MAERISSLLARRDPVVHLLDPHAAVAEAVHVMASRNVGAVLIGTDGRLAGIFTERDLVRRVVHAGRDPSRLQLERVMTEDPFTAAPDDDVEEALRRMQRARCRHLPIVAHQKVADTLSMRDLLFAAFDERALHAPRYTAGEREVAGYGRQS